jgi:uncharacterized tellurite resistance protein B-like protein
MNYNIFTKAEKYAIINILTAIMEADCIIHPKEIEFMDSIFKSFCISAKDNEHMENLDVYGSINIINNMSKDKKEISKKILSDMASADGFLDPREMKIMNSF